ncbi:MAG: hypothetical protein KJ044_15585, partial [Planctomycetes bacterium]|nr:hypothetical protein [Planctomycetota bacterium]
MSGRPHHDSIESVLAGRGVTAGGLSQTEAAARLARNGPNELPHGRQAGLVLVFL